MNTGEVQDMYCDGDKCTISPPHQEPKEEAMPLPLEEVEAETAPATNGKAERHKHDPVPAK